MEEKKLVKPKLTITGYRAIWGKDLNEEITYLYALAFAKLINQKIKIGNEKHKIIIGRDGRSQGIQMLSPITEAFKKENIEVFYAGILPTPTMLMITKSLGFDAGIMLTASHNPIEWNGLKFITNEGRLTNAGEISQLEKIFQNLTIAEKKYDAEIFDIKESEEDNKKYQRIHIEKILENINVESIKNKKFKVAIDTINASGSIIALELLKELNCEIYSINNNPDGNFTHGPEPLAENLTELEKLTRENSCDIGFALDPDADRLVLASKENRIIFEEYSIALSVLNVLQKEYRLNPNTKKSVVVNLVTTNTVTDIAEKFFAHLYRSPVGEANVVSKMLAEGSQIGGEGSGGIIFPPVGYFRDSLSGIALILELLTQENKTIDAILDTLPKYVMKKEKIEIEKEPTEIIEKIKEYFKNEKIDEEDGIRVDFSDASWVQIRASNTEPVLRIFGEGRTKERIQDIFNQVYLTFK